MFFSQHFNNILAEFDYQSVYDALDNDDTSVAVMIIFDQWKNFVLSRINVAKKCVETSESFRSLGNKSFDLMKYGDAFKFYNKALLSAPVNTQAMALALSNRSAVLIQCTQFVEALKDIEKCLQMDCLNANTKRKLEERRERCLKLLTHIPDKSISIGQLKLLEMNSKTHAEISDVSESVNIDMGGTFPVITAARDIHPGTVISIETGFVTASYRHFTDLSCYYCQNFSLNLIPCDSCCTALFCDDICKQKCLQEYHRVECKLANEVYDNIMSLALKALIKIRNKCSDWNEFIQIADDIGKTGIKTNVYNTFSSNSKLSVLTKTFNLGKVYGRQFKFAQWTALLLLHLSGMTSFFPISNNERKKALSAAAKIMMFSFLQTRRVDLGVVIFEVSHSRLHNYGAQVGYFSFLGKLKHSCDPNLQLVPVANKMVLMSLRPIKSGDELTVSYIDHYLLDSNNTLERPLNLYWNMVPNCDCHVCTENWSVKNLKDGEFPGNVATYSKSLNDVSKDPKQNYEMLRDILAKYDHLRNTKLYYKLIYLPFQYFIGNSQYFETENKLLEKIYPIE